MDGPEASSTHATKEAPGGASHQTGSATILKSVDGTAYVSLHFALTTSGPKPNCWILGRRGGGVMLGDIVPREKATV